MFSSMRQVVPESREIAPSGLSGRASVGKVRRPRDIVNFMNFASGDAGKGGGGTAD
jgi:hypothetical protein